MASRPIIRINLEHTTIDALLDSGSDVSLVASSCVKRAILRSDQLDIRLAVAGDGVRTIGSTDLQFQINQYSYQATCHAIPDLGVPTILGRDFLSDEAVIMDFSRACAYIGAHKRQTVYWSTSKPTHARGECVLLALSDEINQDVKLLVQEYSDLFRIGLQQPTTRTTKHRIALKSEKIVNRRCYSLSPEKRQILYQQVDEMLQAGVTRPSNSPYSSSPVLVLRPDKKPLFCVDFRPLNDLTKDESANLPRITDSI